MKTIDIFLENLILESNHNSLLLLDIDDTLVTAENIFIYRNAPHDTEEVRLTPAELAKDPFASKENDKYYDYREFDDDNISYDSIVQYGKPIIGNLQIMDRYVNNGWKIGILTARGSEDNIFKTMNDFLYIRNREGTLEAVSETGALERELVFAINDNKKKYEGKGSAEKKLNVMKELTKKFDRVWLIDDDGKNVKAVQEAVAKAARQKKPLNIHAIQSKTESKIEKNIKRLISESYVSKTLRRDGMNDFLNEIRKNAGEIKQTTSESISSKPNALKSKMVRNTGLDYIVESPQQHMTDPVLDLILQGKHYEAADQYIQNQIITGYRVPAKADATISKIIAGSFAKGFKGSPAKVEQTTKEDWDKFKAAYETIVKTDMKPIERKATKGRMDASGQRRTSVSPRTNAIKLRDKVQKLRDEVLSEIPSARTEEVKDDLERHVGGLNTILSAIEYTIAGRPTLPPDTPEKLAKLKERYKKIGKKFEEIKGISTTAFDDDDEEPFATPEEIEAAHERLSRRRRRLIGVPELRQTGIPGFDESLNLKGKILAESLEYKGQNFWSNYTMSMITKAFAKDLKLFKEQTKYIYAKAFGESTIPIFEYMEQNSQALNEVVQTKSTFLFETYSFDVLNEAPRSTTTIDALSGGAGGGSGLARSRAADQAANQRALELFRRVTYADEAGRRAVAQRAGADQLQRAAYGDVAGRSAAAQRAGADQLQRAAYGDVAGRSAAAQRAERIIRRRAAAERAVGAEDRAGLAAAEARRAADSGQAVYPKGFLAGLWDKIKEFGGPIVGRLAGLVSSGVTWAKNIAEQGMGWIAANPIAQVAVPAIVLAGSAVGAVKLINRMRRKKGEKRLSRREVQQLKRTATEQSQVIERQKEKMKAGTSAAA